MPEQPKDKAPLDLNPTSMLAMTGAVSMLKQMNGILSEMSRNPLGATLSVYGIERQLSNTISHIKTLRAEARATNKEFLTLKDPKSWLLVGTAIASAGAMLQGIRTEIAKTQLELYRSHGPEMLGEGGFAGAMGFTKKSLELQSKYGSAFVQIFHQTVRDIQARLHQEGMTPARQQQFLELLTGMTMLTGKDYGRTINELEESFHIYGTTAESALAATELIRDMWNNSATASGNLNENMDASITLLKEFAAQGMNLPSALKALTSMEKIASQAGMSPGQMLEMYHATAQPFGESGEAAYRARNTLAELIPRTAAVNKLFEPYGNMPRGDAMYEMQRNNPAALLAVLQEHAKHLVPTIPIPMRNAGMVDQRKWANTARQGEMVERMGGISPDLILRLAGMKPFDMTARTQGKTYEQMQRELAGKGLAEFAADVDKAIHATVTWYEQFTKMLENMVKFNPVTGGILDTGIPEGLGTIGGGIGTLSTGILAYKALKSGFNWIRSLGKGGKAAAMVEKAVEAATKTGVDVSTYAKGTNATSTGALSFETAAKTIPKVAEEVTVLGKFGSILRFISKRFAGSAGGMDFARVISESGAEDTAERIKRGSKAATEKESIVKNAGQNVYVIVNLDGRVVASEVQTQSNYVQRSTPPTLLARP